MLAVTAGCDAVADQVAVESTTTIVPLPTAATAPAVVTTLDPAPSPSTTVGGTSTTSPPVTTGTTPPAQPVGDWDGARFDFGRLVDTGRTADGRYRTIELDRYSYRPPSGTLIDAAGFTSEPVAYWWRTEPWANNNPATRRFVLAPDAEVLALSEEGAAAACAEPPPAEPPAPVWLDVGPELLDTDDARGAVVSITYAPDGAVARLRATTGC